jgi:hypothetical protein
VNGYIVNSIDEAVAAVDKLQESDRLRCRRYFEGHFTASIMARNYVEIYERLIERKKYKIRALINIAHDKKGRIGITA